MEMAFDGRPMLLSYRLQLEFCSLSAPVRKTRPIDVPGSDGKLDLLQNWGEPTWEMRDLTARFTLAGSGKPAQILPHVIRDLEGRKVPIMLPDDYGRYLMGTPHVSAASDRIEITARCDPWIFNGDETVLNFPAASKTVSSWANWGMRLAVPRITVSGSAATLSARGIVTTVDPGTYLMPDFAIPGGEVLQVEISGGAVAVTYREANLI